jgi:hypothetical protein
MKSIKFVALALVLILQCQNTFALDTVAKVLLKKSTINSILDNVIPDIKAIILGIKLADIIQENVEIKNIKVTKFGITKANTDFVLSEGTITFVAKYIDFEIDLDYKASKWIASTSGHVSGGANDIEISVGIKVEVTSDQKLLPKIDSVNFKIGELNVTLSGGPIAAIANFFKDLFKNQIRNILQDQIQKAILKQAPPAINKAVSNVTSTLPVPGTELYLSYSFPQAPKISSEQIEIYLGAIIHEKNKDDKPTIDGKNTMDTIAGGKDDAQVYISERLINTLGWAIWKGNLINVILPHTIVPPGSPLNLTTTVLENIFTSVSDHPHTEIPVDLRVRLSDAPNVQVSKDKMTAVLPISIDFLEGNSKDSAKPILYTLTAEFVVSLKAHIVESKIFGDVEILEARALNLENNNRFEVKMDEAGLRYLLNTVLKIGLPVVRAQVLTKGFDIPNLPYLGLLNPRLHFEDGFLLVQAQPEYKGTDIKALLEAINAPKTVESAGNSTKTNTKQRFHKKNRHHLKVNKSKKI